MSSTLESRPDAPHYVDYEEYVDFQLEKTRSSIKLTDIFTTLTTLAVAVIGYLLVFVIVDQWVLDGGFGYVSRVCLLSILMAGVLGTLAWRVLVPLLRRVHPLYAARVIERSDPNLKSNLVNFVDVRHANARSTPIVLKAMEKRAAVELSHIDVEEAVDRRPLLRIAYALLGIVVVSALYIIFSPKDPFASVKRALLPTAAIDVATETTISDVTPGDKDVPARVKPFTIEADIRGNDAERARILFTTADHKYVDEAVEMKRIEESMPRFRGELLGENGRGLLQSLTYRIVAGDAHTRDFIVNVIQPPSARVDEVQYEFPTYMQLENTTTQEGHIDGWEGTRVTVRATTNVPVKSATIVLTDVEDTQAAGEEISMQVADGTNLSTTWKLEFRGDGTAPRYYHIRVRTPNGETDPAPTQYTLRIRPDQRPEVALLAPTSDLDMPANGVVPLVIQATDPDFQLRSITLKAEKNGDAFPDQKLFNNENLGQTFRGNHDFRLEPLRLKAGETIQFWVEVKDNKQPTANRANTPRVNVRIGEPANPEAVKQELEREKQKQQEQLNRADDANNPDKVENLPPPDKGDDVKPENPKRPDPNEDQPKGDKKPPEREPENTPNPRDEPKDEQSGQQKKPAPDDFQKTLEKLAQKEQQQQEAEENKPNEEQKPQAGDEKDSTEKGAGKNSADNKSKAKGKKEGDQSESGRGDSQSTRKDSARPNPTSPDGKSPPDGRADGKKQKAADKTKPKPENQSRENGDDKQPSQGADGKKEKTRGKGSSDDKSDADDKPADDGKKDADNEKTADKDPGKANTGKKAADGDKSGNDEQPGDKSKTQEDNDLAKSDTPPEDSGKDGKGPTKDAGAKSEDKNDGKPDSQAGKPQPDDQEKSGADEQSAADKQKQKQGGAGKKGDEESDPAANSNDKQKGKGSPNTNKPEGDPQEGNGDGEKSKNTGDDSKKQGKSSDPGAEERPAADSPDAQKKQADGTESGEATGDKDGDSQAPRAQKDLKKKDGSDPGAQKSSNSDKGAKKPGEKRRPEDAAKGGSADPDQARRAPDAKKDTEQPGELDEPQSKPRTDIKKDGKNETRPDQPPDAGNRPLEGPGRKDGQKADSPDTGEEGSSAATDQGKPGANKEGPGDKSDESGNTDKAAEKTGQAGSEKGKGSKTKPSEKDGQKEDGAGGEACDKPSQDGKGKPGGKSGQGGGKPADEKSSTAKGKGKPGDQKGPAGSGDKGDKPGQKGGKSDTGKSDGKSADGKADGEASEPGKPGKSGQSKSGGGMKSPPGDGDEPADGGGGASDAEAPQPRDGSNDDEPPSVEEDEANLEFARKASNLVLNRLKGQLERGEVDQELLDELGWKDKKDVEKFVQSLEKGLNARDDDNSPEALARRLQFEETLKSLRLGNDTGRRDSGDGKSRVIRQHNAKDVPVPPEYRKLYESYTRSLSKQADPAKDKSKKK